LYHVAAKRTTHSFATKLIDSIIKALKSKYEFLRFVNINEIGELIEDKAIEISQKIDIIKKE
jgi:hypothetical protein